MNSNCQYDIVILDEVETLFKSVIQNHVKRRLSVWQTLCRVITRAKKVYCLDANISDLSLNIIHRLLGSENIHFVKNNYKSAKGYSAKFFKDNQKLINDMIDQLILGKRCAFLTNSKRLTDKIEIIVKSHQLLKDKVIIKYSSKTGNRKDFQIMNKKLKDDKVDLIICTPILGAGNDIWVDHIQIVYGYYLNNEILTAADQEQQLARFRTCKDLRIWAQEVLRNKLVNRESILK